MKKEIEIHKLAERIASLSPYENLKSIIGDDMGQAIYELISEVKIYKKEKDELIDAIDQLLHLVETRDTHVEPEIYNAKKVLHKHKTKTNEKV